MPVHVLYRNTSAYTEAPLLLGVFRTEAGAAKAKQEYVAKMNTTGDVLHRQQAYQDVNLDEDVHITEQTLNTLEDDGVNEVYGSDDILEECNPHPILYCLSCESEGFGQVARGAANLFTRLAFRDAAVKTMEETVLANASWPTSLVLDMVRLDMLRTRNLETWTGDKSTPVEVAGRMIGDRVRDAARAYDDVVKSFDKLLMEGSSDKSDREEFIKDSVPLLVDPAWPGIRHLYTAHGIVQVWLGAAVASDVHLLDVLADVLHKCDSHYPHPEAGDKQANETYKTTKARRAQHAFAQALRYILDDFRSYPIAV
jgi:hypothetical protein